ncbi:AAR118Cp [Eremothecium gossypii ATCC 10895]|uniref:AAR118Cp n=1 Tax=Eremothecium gossypii (strain ATCC 10895 / CBS 109.51 / FGSC 9923 / NRRL Y-1056) TaxID=284811 RepID=Q75EU3_EREGS|nr:AAR118Cp [Eremothecium gossypii ATCC 10895]AAS50484.1 AAR118Cp [Eremothecium gossypii ATCC 10895]AEY94771.1 FAAR118Cp [Eremothecium gossypii FDAG1]
MEGVCGPARVRVLVVPASDGWRRGEFLGYVERLRESPEVRLVDITPIADSMFNPQGFPQGKLLFEIEVEAKDESSMLFLYDFEPYRKTFVVVGLCQGTAGAEAAGRLAKLEAKFPHCIGHCLIYQTAGAANERVLGFGASSETLMCDVGRCFLRALHTYYLSYKHVTLRSPGAVGGNAVLKTTFMCRPAGPNAKRLSATLENGTGSKKGSLKGAKVAAPDRSQQRAKGRQLKILANFQLLAGQYMSALANFSEAAHTAHKVRDHLWLGSALEGVFISMILLSYLAVPFQIPAVVVQLCPPKSYVVASASSSQRSSSSSISGSPNSGANGAFQSPRPSMSGPNAPVLHSNEVLLGNLLKCLNERVLHYYELSLTQSVEYTPQVVYCQSLLRMLQFMSECHKSNSLGEPALRSMVLGVTHEPEAPADTMEPILFSKMEIYQLSNRFFELQLKDLDLITQVRFYITLASVYGNLSLERKRAFVLRILFVSLLPNIEALPWRDEYDNLMEELLRTYGIASWEPENKIQDALSVHWVTLQKNVLILLINIVKKAGRARKVLKFSRWAITRYSHILTHTEQTRLFKDFLLPAAQQHPEEFEYCDPFLLRNISLLKLEHHRQVPTVEHLEIASNSENKGEIFNPFKYNDVAAPEASNDDIENFMVSERAEFICSFQNPFNYDLDITSLSLCQEDVKYLRICGNQVSSEAPFIVKAHSMRALHLTVEFLQDTPGHKLRALNIGLFKLPARKYPICNSEQKSVFASSRAVLGECKLVIIEDQPQLDFLSSDLPRASCMLLTGVKKRLQCKVHNTSLSKTANYFRFCINTNVSSQLKDDYWRTIAADDLYDMELQLEQLKEKCIKVTNFPDEIKPNEVVLFDLEIDSTCAPLHLDHFDLVINYGNNHSGNNAVYVRKLVIPFNVTLKRSVEVTNMEIVQIHEELPSTVDVDWINYIRAQMREQQLSFSAFALMLLDIRNSWTSKVVLELGYDDFSASPHEIGSCQTIRIIVPIKKLRGNSDLSDRPIPSIVRGRQFVHSGLSDDQLHDLQTHFWCREHLLSKLHCTWKGSSFAGTVNFRLFMPKLSNNAIAVMYRSKKTPYTLELRTSDPHVSVCEEVTITATIDASLEHDSTSTVFVQFQFFERRTGKQIPNSNKQLLYNGTLMNSIDLRTQQELTLKVLPIESGDYEFHGSIVGTDAAAYSLVHVT